MFNKLKQFRDLRSQAKTIQNALSQESVTVEKSGVKIMMNGNMEVTSVSIVGEMNNEKIAVYVKEAMNDAVKKTQKIMAQKMQEMGGLPGLS